MAFSFMQHVILSIVFYVKTTASTEDGYNSTYFLTSISSGGDSYTISPYVTADISLQPAREENLNCFSDSQVDMMTDAVSRVIVTEIQNQNFNFAWDYLKKFKIKEELLLEKIVTFTMNNEIIRCKEGFGHSCNRFNYLLNFINDTPDTELRLIGYRAAFQEISSNSINQPTNWLSLHHFVSHDKSMYNAKFLVLLTEIELKTNAALESPDFDYLRNTDGCSSSHVSNQILYMDYLIKRFCSTDPANIQILLKIFQNKSSPIELYVQFVKELEQNKRLNYSIMAIPHLRSKWWQIEKQSETCTYFRQVFPQNSTLRHLLTSTNNRYFIKNVYSGQYLCYEDSPKHSYYWSYRDEIKPMEPTNVFICASKNSTWQFRGNDEFSIVSGHTLGRSLILEKCKLHNEWFVSLNKDHIKKYGYEKLDFRWEMEMTDISNERFRFKSVTNEAYLRVGFDHNLLISMTECNGNDEKSEWIIEREPESIFVDITCKGSELIIPDESVVDVV